MKILSIDVGIKNLAFCLFEKSENSDYFKITKWDTVNISEQHEIQNCIFIDKIGLCNKPAKFSKDDQCFCLKHSKKQNYQIPTSLLSIFIYYLIIKILVIKLFTNCIYLLFICISLRVDRWRNQSRVQLFT